MTPDEFSYAAIGIIAAAVVLAGAAYWIRRLVMDWREGKRGAQRRRIEAELDQEVAQLRTHVEELELQLSGDALEARKALIRESFLASGKTPKA